MGLWREEIDREMEDIMSTKTLSYPKNVNYKQHLHNFKYNSDKMKLTERNQHAKCAVFIWGLDKLGVY